MSVFSRHFLSSCQFLHFPFAKTRKPQYKIYRRLEDSFIHLKFESMKVKRYRSIHTAPRHRSTSQWSPASYVEIAGATCKKKQPGKATSSTRCSLATCSARTCRSVWTTRRAKNRPENRKLHRFFGRRHKTLSAPVSESMVSALRTCQFKTANSCKCPSGCHSTTIF